MEIHTTDIKATNIKDVPEYYRSLRSKNVGIVYRALIKAIEDKYSNGLITKFQHDTLISVLDEVLNERLMSLLVEDNLNKFYNTINFSLNQALNDMVFPKNKNERISFSYSKKRLQLIKYGK